MTSRRCSTVLTTSLEDSRSRARLQTLSPQPEKTALAHDPIFPFAISASHKKHPPHPYDGDVVRELSVPPESANSSIPRYPASNGFYSSSYSTGLSTETSRFYLPTTPHQDALNQPTPRLRTLPRNLIVQHGLPLSLPPPPRTTFISHQQQQQQPQPPIPPQEQSLVSALDSFFRNSYSDMLKTPTNTVMDNSTSEQARQGPGESSVHVSKRKPVLTVAPISPLPVRLRLPVEIDPSADFSIDEMLQSNLWEEPYLTSPQLDDSPEETPFIDTPLETLLDSSPLIGFEDDSYNLNGMPLFGAEVTARKEVDVTADTNESLLQLLAMLQPQQDITTDASSDTSKIESVMPALPSLDQAMYTMPPTPSLAPVILHHPPAAVNDTHSRTVVAPPSITTTNAQPRVTKPLPTGTRRNITPASLVPLDAPTQPRQYVTPSVTSRKAVPSGFKGKKRDRSEVPEDDEVEIDISHLDPTTKEAIEAKRRQNTLAARRSRQRKLEHVRELEDTVQNLTQDRDHWMQRAYHAEEKLRIHGIVDDDS